MKKEDFLGYVYHCGKFFKYYINNKTSKYILDELEYDQIFLLQIFTNTNVYESNLKNCCFVHALEHLGVDLDLIYQPKTNIVDRFIHYIKINKICED